MTASTITRIGPVPSQYCKAVVHGETVYLAGLIAGNWELDIAGQAQEIFDQIDELLGEAGADKSRLLSVTVFLRSFDDYPAFKTAFSAWADPQNLPARATVRTELLDPRIRIEIMATAAKSGAGGLMKATAARMVADARLSVRHIDVGEALKLLDSPNHMFIDVREESELAAGCIPNALHVARGGLEFVLDKTSESHRSELGGDRTLIMVCGSGGRAVLAAQLASAFGYHALCLEGGMRAWKGADGPVE